MAPSFQDSGRYFESHRAPDGPGDVRPTARQIILDNDLIGQMKDKVILLTGGSNGIGVEEVRALALTGATVVFTSRDPAKGQRVRAEIVDSWMDDSVQPKVEVLQMDLQSLENVRSAAEEFKTRHDKLNILINNAGIALTPFKLTADGFEQQFGVNHLAHFYLFLLLKPLLLASSTPTFNSRVVNVASSVHTMGSVQADDYNFQNTNYDPFVGYASSKTCNIWMANEIDRRYGSKGLHSISVHPGGIETGLEDGHDEVAKKTMASIIEQHTHIQKAFKNTEQGAASVVLAAVGKEYEGAGGFYMEDCGVSPPLAKDAPLGSPGYMPWAYDEQGERRLWADSLKMLKLTDD